MLLIVGLGNPGAKYQNNRHNVGFMLVDYIAKLLDGHIAEKNNNNITIKQYDNLLLGKPLTFMNNSGKAVKQLFQEYKLKPSNLIVIHDDLDIPLGKFKIQIGTGPQLHNGLESIENHLKTKEFWRVRIGVDNRMNTGWIDGETYSLQDFRPEEKKVVKELFPLVWDRLKKQLSMTDK